MRQAGVANLVIMDQFGVKEVTPDVVNTLAECRMTDILFFVSSSYIRRFASDPSIQNYFSLDDKQLAESEHKSIHRHICNYFRSRLRSAVEYHLAPFSIKKGGNIHGVIFGSSNLLGLQKFLEVCWDLDKATGEANYDIDNDPAWRGDPFLFDSMNEIRKQDKFQRDLEDRLLASDAGDKTPVTNRAIYRFVLENGFLPKHAVAHLRSLQKAGRLEVTDPSSDNPVKRGAFYLSWDCYRKESTRAVFRLKD